ncbi:hypothetical protein HDU76_005014 [Blyttiomyces sp. JEL0837]|nr:hypothetical protein HDU76_005014 [Blyttiomyces sp. JEL0837]
MKGVYISDCTNTGTLLANQPGQPGYHSIFIDSQISPLSLDFTKSIDGKGYIPLLNISKIDIKMNLGDHLTKQDLSFSRVNQTIIFNSPNANNGLDAFASVTTSVPSSGSSASQQLTHDFVNVAMDGTLGNQNPPLDNPFTAFVAATIGASTLTPGGPLPYFVNGVALTNIDAGVMDTSAPNRAFTFCLGNITYGAASAQDTTFKSQRLPAGGFAGSFLINNTDTTKSSFTITSADDIAITFSHSVSLQYVSDVSLTLGDIQVAFVHANANANPAIAKTTLGTTTIKKVALPGVVAPATTANYIFEASTVVNNPLPTDATYPAYLDFLTNYIGYASVPYVAYQDPVNAPPKFNSGNPNPILTPSFQGSTTNVNNLPALTIPLSKTNFDTLMTPNKNPLIIASTPISFKSTSLLGEPVANGFDANLNITITNPFDVNVNVIGIQAQLIYPGGVSFDFGVIAQSNMTVFEKPVVVGKGVSVVLPELNLDERRVPATLLAVTEYLKSHPEGVPLYLYTNLTISFDKMSSARTYTISYQQLANAVLLEDPNGGGFGGFGGFGRLLGGVKKHFAGHEEHDVEFENLKAELVRGAGRKGDI